MKVLSYEETMLRRKRVHGIIAAVVILGAAVLGVMGHRQWFYALGLLGLSFASAFLFYSAKSLNSANAFHALRVIFGSLFVTYVLVQLILIFF